MDGILYFLVQNQGDGYLLLFLYHIGNGDCLRCLNLVLQFFTDPFQNFITSAAARESLSMPFKRATNSEFPEISVQSGLGQANPATG